MDELTGLTSLRSVLFSVRESPLLDRPQTAVTSSVHQAALLIPASHARDDFNNSPQGYLFESKYPRSKTVVTARTVSCLCKCCHVIALK